MQKFEYDGKNYVLAEDYLKENTNNEAFRSGTHDFNDLKTLVEVDNHNNIINLDNISDYALNADTNEVVNRKELFKAFGENPVVSGIKEDIKNDIILTQYKDMAFLDTLIKDYISNCVIDRENECLQEKFKSENYGEPEEFLEDLKNKLFEATSEDFTLRSHIQTFDGSLLEENQQDRNSVVLHSCINVAVNEKQENLLHSLEMEKLYMEVDKAVYEDVKEEIENNNINLD